MRQNRTLFLLSIFFSLKAAAFPCYVTVMKDSCWKDYSVSVDLMDTSTEKVVSTVTIPEGETWARASFTCQPKQTFKLMGHFSPAFWQADEGKTYYGKRYWSLPETTEGGVAWDMKICYASEFALVPLPPDAQGGCQCNTSEPTPLTK